MRAKNSLLVQWNTYTVGRGADRAMCRHAGFCCGIIGTF